MDSQQKRICLSAVVWSPGEIFSCCVLSGEGRERFGSCSVEGQNRLSSLSAMSCAHMPELRKNTQTLQMSNMRNPGSEGRHEHSLHFTCCKTCKTNYKLDVKLCSSIKLKLSSIQKSYAGPKFTLVFTIRKIFIARQSSIVQTN